MGDLPLDKPRLSQALNKALRVSFALLGVHEPEDLYTNRRQLALFDACRTQVPGLLALRQVCEGAECTHLSTGGTDCGPWLWLIFYRAPCLPCLFFAFPLVGFEGNPLLPGICLVFPGGLRKKNVMVVQCPRERQVNRYDLALASGCPCSSAEKLGIPTTPTPYPKWKRACASNS